MKIKSIEIQINKHTISSGGNLRNRFSVFKGKIEQNRRLFSNGT